MTQPDNVKEALAWAREQAARHSESMGEPGVASQWRSGLHDELPDITMRVEAYLAGASRAPSPGASAREISEQARELLASAASGCSALPIRRAPHLDKSSTVTVSAALRAIESALTARGCRGEG